MLSQPPPHLQHLGEEAQMVASFNGDSTVTPSDMAVALSDLSGGTLISTPFTGISNVQINSSTTVTSNPTSTKYGQIAINFNSDNSVSMSIESPSGNSAGYAYIPAPSTTTPSECLASGVTNAPATNVTTANYTSCTSIGGATSLGGGGASLTTTTTTATTTTTIAAPGVPTNFTATPSTTSVSLSWSAPTSGGTPTSYLTYQNNTLIATTTSTTTTYLVSSLTANTSYTFAVAATNTTGTSSQATLNATTLPLSPTALVASSPTTNSITISWSNPTEGNASLTYTLYENGAVVASNLTSPTYVVGALNSNTSYTFTVVATNSEGASPSSSGLTTGTIPDAPTGLVINGVFNSELVSYTAPGGPLPLTYNILLNGALYTTTTSTSVSIPASYFPSGTSFLVQVVAVNAYGSSAAS
jgi:hypothetical protein